VKEMTWGNFGFFVFESSATFYGRWNIKSGFFSGSENTLKFIFSVSLDCVVEGG
jgi:hypothetical protein